MIVLDASAAVDLLLELRPVDRAAREALEAERPLDRARLFELAVLAGEREALVAAPVREAVRAAGADVHLLDSHLEVARAEPLREQLRLRVCLPDEVARRVDDATEWIESYRRTWNERFDRLQALIDRQKGST